MGDLLSMSESDNEALEAVRGFGDGQQWLLDQIRQAGASGIENAPAIPGSTTPISNRAFDLIVMLEVTSQAAYEHSYSHPTWPQGASGVTIGIGYDVGYVSKSLLWQDWQGAIPDAMIADVTWAARSTDVKSASRVLTVCGFGVSLTVTSSASPKHPSDPMNAPRRSYPSRSPTLLPSSTTSPLGNRTVIAST